MGEWLLSRRDRLIVARHEYVFSAGYPHGPKGPAVWTFRDSSASLNRFFLRKLRETYVPEGPEFGVWVDGIFHLESIRHAGLAATQIKLQASLRGLSDFGRKWAFFVVLDHQNSLPPPLKTRVRAF
jgi:hypothetical protein